MEKQNNWKYNFELTNNHPLSRKFSACIEKINLIVNREGCSKVFFKDEVALNLDCIEKILARSEKRDLKRTMDISFCISCGNNANMVLVELRLKYTKPENIGKTEIDNKIRHSREIIPVDTIIHNKYYFLFPEKIKNQAYSIIRRLYSNRSNYQVLDLEGFRSLFFYKKI